MNSEEADKELKEKTKWMLESEYKELHSVAKDLFDLQRKVFSPEYDCILSNLAQAMTREQVSESFELTREVAKVLDGQKAGNILLSLTYLLTESLRSARIDLEKT